jgi:hypothetical protein
VSGRGGRDLLEEWRQAIESVIAPAATLAGRSELPRELLKATRRQVELMQEVLDGERTIQRELANRVFAPFDAVFDLLEETGAVLRRQAETLEAAGAALEETAGLMKRQAELFERTIGALRQPAELAKAATGAKRRQPKARKPRSR